MGWICAGSRAGGQQQHWCLPGARKRQRKKMREDEGLQRRCKMLGEGKIAENTESAIYFRCGHILRICAATDKGEKVGMVSL